MFNTLVDVATLREHLFDARWCVIDCRHDLMNPHAGWEAYQAGHIPGAAFAHVDEDLSGAKTGKNGRHPLPHRDDIVQALRDWGADDDSQIVVYDAAGGQFAGRLWWLTRWLGHERVALLDGGWPAWLAQTQWTSTELPDRPAGSFTARTSRVAIALADEVESARCDPARVLVDARAAERYEGRVEPIDPVAGHIPGAVNRFWQDNLVDGRFKAPTLLRAEFEALLAGRPPQALIAHCGSGVTACHHLLAMEVAGLQGAALYPGSWSEWIADPKRAVVKV
jgi:thiosulfate/3-mercaptopyruvate sulfurtransferase